MVRLILDVFFFSLSFGFSGGVGAAVRPAVPRGAGRGVLPAWGELRGGRSHRAEHLFLRGEGDRRDLDGVLAGRSDGLVQATPASALRQVGYITRSQFIYTFVLIFGRKIKINMYITYI